MSEPTAEEAIALGRDAKALVENETFQRVIAHLRETTMAQWRGTASGSVSLREHYFFEIHGLDAIEGRLATLIEDADYANARIEKANSRKP